MSCKRLADAIKEGDREIELPLKLTDYELIECLRFLPGKRAVFRGVSVSGRSFVIKTFLKHCHKDFNAELSGNRLLEAARISTPRLIGHISLPNIDMVVYEYIEDAVSLNANLKDSLSSVVSLLEQMHSAGLIQADIHPDNFLVKGSMVYLIDCGSVKEAAVSGQRENLALFVAQFPWLTHENIVAEVGLSKAVLAEAEILWRNRVKKYLRKIYRECSQVVAARGTGYRALWEREYDCIAMQIIEDIDYYIAEGRLLKDGNSATVVMINVGKRQFVIKRYNPKSLWHAIRKSLRPSRASNAWLFGHFLPEVGIRTPKPVLMYERFSGCLRKESYIVNELAVGGDLLSEFNQRALSDSEVRDLKGIFTAFRCLRVSHGDLKATNLITDGRRVSVIDLDSMTWRHRLSSKKAYRKDLNRFLRNWNGERARIINDLIDSN